MKKNLRVPLKSFAAALLATLASVVWLCNYTVSGGQALLIVGISAAALFLPWERWKTASRILWVAAAAASFRLGVALTGRLYPEIPQWGWWIGWALLLILLAYLGKRALYECALIPSLAVVLALLCSFAVSWGSFDGVIEWSGPPWYRVTGGVVVLTGCALSGLSLVPHRSAGKAGALTGILVWGLVGFVPLIMWSWQALEIVSPALPQSWGRLGFLSCPDVLLTALCATAALWQCGVSVGLLAQVSREQ